MEIAVLSGFLGMGRREVKLRNSGGARPFRLTVASCPRNLP